MELLKFGKANRKLKALEVMVGKVFTFSLLSGHTCPMADKCLSKVVDGKVVDGPNTEFRCFSASEEAIYTNVYAVRKYNTDLIKSCGNNIQKMTELILESIPPKANCIRVHVGGDFFTLNYMIAWNDVARLLPSVRFYAYTKSIPMWIKCIERNVIPSNFIFTASYGGKFDNLIESAGLRFARVVYSVLEAETLGLEIDHDDYHAATNGPSFALLVHGIQPAGSAAGKAVRKLNGLGSYGKRASKLNN